MAPTTDDVVRVSDFRNQLVAFANYVAENYNEYQPISSRIQAHIASQQAELLQEYGALSALLTPYGTAMMKQYNMIVSQDVVYDAIHSPGHPGYGDVVHLAVGHLDLIIGRMRAVAREPLIPGVTRETLYRYTSPVYWAGRLVALARWLLTTNRGRITALIGIVVVAIISGIVSGIAQGWYQHVFGSLARREQCASRSWLRSVCCYPLAAELRRRQRSRRQPQLRGQRRRRRLSTN